jgi:hypothetical protein
MDAELFGTPDFDVKSWVNAQVIVQFLQPQPLLPRTPRKMSSGLALSSAAP